MPRRGSIVVAPIYRTIYLERVHRLGKKLARATMGSWPSGRLFGPGEVRLALLSLLADAPAHGYELMTRLESRTAGAYQASAGTVYPTLGQLEDEGLVRVKLVDERRVFEPTARGKDELRTRADEVAAIWRRVDEWSDWGGLRNPESAEIVAPALRLAKAALRAVVKSHADPSIVQAVRDILDDARTKIERLRGARR
jgi:DNA-binding PadR family transcriptional regulator